MAALTPPTIKESVYNRIPYLDSSEESNDTLIDQWTAEVMSELKAPLGKSDDDASEKYYLELDAYSNQENSLIADMVAVNLLLVHVIKNAEGDSSGAGQAGKMLKRAKAGETEVEYFALKATDGTRLMLEAGALLSKLSESAMRKARTIGFILDYSKETAFTIQAYSPLIQSIYSVDYGC